MNETTAHLNPLLSGPVRPALLLTAAGWFTLPGLLRLIHTPAEILSLAVLYGRIYLLGLPFLMLYDLSKECVIGCGNSKMPLRAVGCTSLLNIVLDLVLVGPFGVGGTAAASAYGCTMLAGESITYLFIAQKHLQEARLRGAQKMGLYLISNLGQIGPNLLFCVLLVPRIGFSGFWLSSRISAPIGLIFAVVLSKIGVSF